MKSIHARVLSFILAVLIIAAIPGCQQKPEEANKTGEDHLNTDFSTPVTITFCFLEYAPSGSESVIAEIKNRLSGSLNIKLDIKCLADSNTFVDKVKSIIS